MVAWTGRDGIPVFGFAVTFVTPTFVCVQCALVRAVGVHVAFFGNLVETGEVVWQVLFGEVDRRKVVAKDVVERK